MKKYLIILSVLIAVGATAQPVWVGQDNGLKADVRKHQKLIPGTLDMTGQIKGGRFVIQRYCRGCDTGRESAGTD